MRKISARALSVTMAGMLTITPASLVFADEPEETTATTTTTAPADARDTENTSEASTGAKDIDYTPVDDNAMANLTKYRKIYDEYKATQGRNKDTQGKALNELSADTVKTVAENYDSIYQVANATRGTNYIAPKEGKGDKGRFSVSVPLAMSIVNNQDVSTWYAALAMSEKDKDWSHVLEGEEKLSGGVPQQDRGLQVNDKMLLSHKEGSTAQKLDKHVINVSDKWITDSKRGGKGDPALSMLKLTVADDSDKRGGTIGADSSIIDYVTGQGKFTRAHKWRNFEPHLKLDTHGPAWVSLQTSRAASLDVMEKKEGAAEKYVAATTPVAPYIQAANELAALKRMGVPNGDIHKEDPTLWYLSRTADAYYAKLSKENAHYDASEKANIADVLKLAEGVKDNLPAGVMDILEAANKAANGETPDADADNDVKDTDANAADSDDRDNDRDEQQDSSGDTANTGGNGVDPRGEDESKATEGEDANTSETEASETVTSTSSAPSEDADAEDSAQGSGDAATNNDSQDGEDRDNGSNANEESDNEAEEDEEDADSRDGGILDGGQLSEDMLKELSESVDSSIVFKKGGTYTYTEGSKYNMRDAKGIVAKLEPGMEFKVLGFYKRNPDPNKPLIEVDNVDNAYTIVIQVEDDNGKDKYGMVSVGLMNEKGVKESSGGSGDSDSDNDSDRNSSDRERNNSGNDSTRGNDRDRSDSNDNNRDSSDQ